ncbi:uncharacterized protein LOC105155578 isoform X2 [Sesamum indicum]|uniref:Uncharacterized protein LOC105155578 isoform X2 n=1 Tax=Sesamum indicum TaxID=4182 RepID=A0A8M8V5B6_SESIN|nr:uncharacterized protein LOC105155578 isoform X2 [Sesamum indicum]
MVKSLVAPSVTKQQIADYWRQRRMIEEDHFSAAIKAAARIRAQKLSENDYFQFEASLEDDENMENKNKISVKAASKKDENEERRVGIKDWWTKSRHAYLNEPVMTSVDKTPRKNPARLPQYF